MLRSSTEALFVDGSVAEKASFGPQTIWKHEVVTNSSTSSMYLVVVVCSHFVALAVL